MRVEEKIEQFGTFWIPENPDEKINGELVVGDGAHITVELYGIFENLELDNESSNIPKVNGIIYGYKSQSTTKIALYECLIARAQGSTNTMDILAHRLIIGEEHREDEDTLLNKISFSFEGIVGWVGENLRPDDVPKYFNRELTGETEVIYNGKVKIPDIYDGDISIDYFLSASRSNQIGIKIEVKREIVLNIFFKQPRSLRNAEIILNDLAIFFSIATGETANIKNVNFSNSTEVDNKSENLIELYYKGRIFSKNVSPGISRKVLLSAKGIKKSDDNTLKKWLEGSPYVHTAFRAYSIYKADREGKFIAGFLALTQAIEILHNAKMGKKEHSERCKDNLPNFRCKANFVNLKCRIQDLIEEFQESVTTTTDDIAQKIVKIRNDHTHHPEDCKEKGFNLEDRASFLEAVSAMNLMERLFQCAFLSEVGFSNFEIEGIVKKP